MLTATHMLSFTKKRKKEKSLLIEGWYDLRSFYKPQHGHCIYFGYVGNSCFQITIFPRKCEPLSIGRFSRKIVTDEPLSRGLKRHFTIGLTPLQVRTSHLVILISFFYIFIFIFEQLFQFVMRFFIFYFSYSHVTNIFLGFARWLWRSASRKIQEYCASWTLKDYQVQTLFEKYSKEVQQNSKWLEVILYYSWTWWNSGPGLWSWANEVKSACQSVDLF